MNNRYIVTYAEIIQRIAKLKYDFPAEKFFGVPRGGTYVAAMTGRIVATPEEADIILDDLIDSGKTRDKWMKLYPDKPFIALFSKEDERHLKGKWLCFPWEGDQPNKDAEENIGRVLQFFGYDLNKDGLLETPKRYVKFLKEFFAVEPFEFKTFEGDGYDEMIISSNIPFFSLCEHHLAPFFGTASIAYIPGDSKRIVGISKLPRVLDHFSRRLQNQERITMQVAQKLMEELKPAGVAVVLKARHFCQEMRGIKKHDIYTTTSYMTGKFKEDLNCRQEFLNLIK